MGYNFKKCKYKGGIKYAKYLTQYKMMIYTFFFSQNWQIRTKGERSIVVVIIALIVKTTRRVNSENIHKKTM